MGIKIMYIKRSIIDAHIWYDTCISDMTGIRWIDTFLLKIIRYTIYDIYIEKYTIILKNMTNIWLLSMNPNSNNVY